MNNKQLEKYLTTYAEEFNDWSGVGKREPLTLFKFFVTIKA